MGRADRRLVLRRPLAARHGQLRRPQRRGADLSGWRPEDAQNSFAGTGVWAGTKLATDSGGWRQVNRAGHPMMWPIFWPDDVEFTNPANTRHPSEDADADGKPVADLVAATVAASGTVGDPAGYGQALARELFPDVLPYVVGTPATYGFATRNGRTPADNAPEVMMSLVTGTAVPSGLTPAVSERYRAAGFPYVVPA